MKIFRDTSFTNTIRHSSRQDISVPPDLPDYGQWDVSQTMKHEVAATARGFFGGQAGDFDMQDHRICWYDKDSISLNEFGADLFGKGCFYADAGLDYLCTSAQQRLVLGYGWVIP